MRGFVALAIVVGAIAGLVYFHDEPAIAGLRPDQFASLAWFLALAIVLSGTVVAQFRGQWTRALEAIAFWMAMVVVLVALYSYRSEVTAVTGRLMGELTPGTADVAEGGEVAITRRLTGEFLVRARVNTLETRFLFDTGATTVVLTSDTARKAGIDTGRLVYSHPVITANGRTMAASVTLDRVAIGSIVEHRVRALVAKPGILHENLLGMSFLDRLASYEVRGDRLILRGRDGGRAELEHGRVSARDGRAQPFVSSQVR